MFNDGINDVIFFLRCQMTDFRRFYAKKTSKFFSDFSKFPKPNKQGGLISVGVDFFRSGEPAY